LFGTNSSEQVLHVVQVREEKWGSLSVIRMDVTDFHVLESIFIVVLLSILSLVLDLRTNQQMRFKISTQDIRKNTYSFGGNF